MHKVAVLEPPRRQRQCRARLRQGFGALRGALASSIGHDSHNIIVVGADDADMALAVNRLIELQGGASRWRTARCGRSCPADRRADERPAFEEVAARLRALRACARAGLRAAEPFLQLAFLPLPVIPHLKLTDKGLVDVDRFKLIAA